MFSLIYHGTGAPHLAFKYKVAREGRGGGQVAAMAQNPAPAWGQSESQLLPAHCCLSFLTANTLPLALTLFQPGAQSTWLLQSLSSLVAAAPAQALVLGLGRNCHCCNTCCMAGQELESNHMLYLRLELEPEGYSWWGGDTEVEGASSRGGLETAGAKRFRHGEETSKGGRHHRVVAGSVMCSHGGGK